MLGHHIEVKIAKDKKKQDVPRDLHGRDENGNYEEKPVKKLDSIKKHIKDNKTAYISAGTGAVGVAAGVAMAGGNQKVIVDAFNFTLLKWHSPTTNVVTTVLERRGHPGFIIKCIETGEIFASQNRAAEALGVSATAIARVLKGVNPHASGYTFEKLGEAL